MQVNWMLVAVVVALLAAGVTLIALGHAEVGGGLIGSATVLVLGSYSRPAVSRSIPPGPP